MPVPLPVQFVWGSKRPFGTSYLAPVMTKAQRFRYHAQYGPWPTTARCPKCADPLDTSERGLCNSCKISRYKAINLLSRGVHNAVAKAKKYGLLPLLDDGKTPCMDCGGVASMYDHRDYSKPLAVDPVCGSCNRRRGHAIQVAEYVALNPPPRDVQRRERLNDVA